MLKVVLMSIALFYLAMVLGTYIKLLDFKAPKSSILHAFFIPFLAIKVNILALIATLKKHTNISKFNFCKLFIKCLILAISNLSISSGIFCIKLCELYKERSILKSKLANEYTKNNLMNLNRDMCVKTNDFECALSITKTVSNEVNCIFSKI